MSINLNEKQKFSKLSISTSKTYFNNAEQAKHELQNEYRKIRIKQAREQWNEKAREIRQKIAEEKERQFKNIEAIKEEELNVWRQNVLAKKHHDYYQSSVYDIGSAHRAAKKEKEDIEKLKLLKKHACVRSCQIGGCVVKREGKGYVIKHMENKEKHPKRKRNQVLFEDDDLCNLDFKDIAERCSECERTDNEAGIENTVNATESFDSDSNRTASSQEAPSPKRQATKSPTKHDPKRPKTLPIKPRQYITRTNNSFASTKSQLQVKGSSNQSQGTKASDSIWTKNQKSENDSKKKVCMEKDSKSTDDSKADVVEKSKRRYNQISELIRKKNEADDSSTPDDGRASTKGRTVDVSVQVDDNENQDCQILPEAEGSSGPKPPSKVTSNEPTSATDLSNANKPGQYKTSSSNKTSKSKDSDFASEKPSASDDYKKSSSTKTESRSMGSDKGKAYPLKTAPTKAAFTPSSYKSATSLVAIPQNTLSATTYVMHSESTSPRGKPTSKTSGSKSSLLKSALSAANTTGDVSSKPSVQYYDYNNKFAKTYSGNQDAVSKEGLEESEPNAMGNAELEKEYLDDLNKKAELLRQVAEGRGQIALEREQVRRDCVELTEKLDALTKQRAGLPSDINLFGPNYFERKNVNREKKMNSAIENLLLEPAIITLPEKSRYDLGGVRDVYTAVNPSTSKSNEINLAYDDDFVCSVTSSDTPSAILLGYVEDRKEQIKKELATSKNDVDKKSKLESLLGRIEKIRLILLSELDNIDSNPELTSKLTAKLFEEDANSAGIVNGKTRKGTDTETRGKCDDIKAREQTLKKKEVEFERRLREFYEEKKGQNPTSSKQERRPGDKVCNDNKVEVIDRRKVAYEDPSKPIEIVIKVKSDAKNLKAYTESGEEKGKKTNELRETCDDSNSTSYRSLPPNVNPPMERIFANEQKQMPTNAGIANKENQDDCNSFESTRGKRLNPMVAQYIQRLLCMSRDSINLLGVSSSDVDSPSSSVINSSTNMTIPKNLVNDEKLNRVQEFLNDNYSFVSDLEQSLNQTRQNSCHEVAIDETRLKQVWTNLLKKHLPVAVAAVTKQKDIKAKKSGMTVDKQKVIETVQTAKKKPSNAYNARSQADLDSSDVISTTTTEDDGRCIDKKMAFLNRRAMEAPRRMRTKTQMQMDANEKPVSSARSDKVGDPIQQYEKLTENCTKRIEELTDLINKVREDKHRLVEATMTSISDNTRNSTEHLDLPEGKGKGANKKCKPKDASSSSSNRYALDSHTTRSGDLPEIIASTSLSDNVPESDHETQMKLQKDKVIGISRDSGISLPSRPVTVQEHQAEPEPEGNKQLPCHSKSLETEKPNTKKPAEEVTIEFTPATPVLKTPMYNDRDAFCGGHEKDHDLSTILEVDTPCTTSRNQNSAMGTGSLQRPHSPPSVSTSHPIEERKEFPSYSQYIAIFGDTDPDKSFSIAEEYQELLQIVKKGGGCNEINYQEFPTLMAYLKNLSTYFEPNCPKGSEIDDDESEADNSLLPKTYNELLCCLSVDKIEPQMFPTHREYVQNMCNMKSIELIDSESLDDISDAFPLSHTECESETLNIEDELRQRKILKEPFRCAPNDSKKKKSKGKSSTQSKAYAHILSQPKVKVADFYGSDSESTACSDLAKEILALHDKPPVHLTETESTSMTSEPSVKHHRKASRKPKHGDCITSSSSSNSKSPPPPFNIQEFFKRELFKPCETSQSSSLSEDSIRSEFMRSVLEDMSAHVSLGETKSCDNANQRESERERERHKTSTPVTSQSPTKGSTSNINCASSSLNLNTEIFSNESVISSIVPNAKVIDKEQGKKK